MDSNGDGNATVGWGWTLNRDPIPQTPLWGPLLAPFSRKTRKKPEILSTNREFFFDSAISQEVGVGSTKLKQVRNVSHPQTLFRKKTGAYGAMRLIPQSGLPNLCIPICWYDLCLDQRSV